MVLKADLIPVMLPFITLIASEESVSWLNYPGLELWKFLNLAIFLSVAIFILRRPLRQALARLAEAEALLAHLDSDIAVLREQSRAEAELEKERLKLATDKELEKLKQQAQRDIETAGKIARQELRRFLANRSVELAKQSVLAEIRPEDDARLIGASIAELRGSKI
jgi:flagellar biosynthesis/type III secretory pathway M-ring protein FliF/YscJ